MDELWIATSTTKPPHTEVYINGERLLNLNFVCSGLINEKTGCLCEEKLNEYTTIRYKIKGEFEFVNGVIKPKVRENNG